MGFIREKRLYRFYLNGKDAFRLVLVVPPPRPGVEEEEDTSSSDGTDVVLRGHGHGAVAGSSDVSSLSSHSNSGRASRASARQQRRPRRHPVYRAIQVSPYSDEEDNDN
jgi:N-alpha-acetyltransferase 30